MSTQIQISMGLDLQLVRLCQTSLTVTVCLTSDMINYPAVGLRNRFDSFINMDFHAWSPLHAPMPVATFWNSFTMSGMDSDGGSVITLTFATFASVGKYWGLLQHVAYGLVH